MDVNGVYKPSDDTDSYKIVYKCYVRYHGITGEILYIGNIYIYIYIIGFLEDCQSMVLWNGYLTIVYVCYLTIVIYKPWIEY